VNFATLPETPGQVRPSFRSTIIGGGKVVEDLFFLFCTLSPRISVTGNVSVTYVGLEAEKTVTIIIDTQIIESTDQRDRGGFAVSFLNARPTEISSEIPTSEN